MIKLILHHYDNMNIRSLACKHTSKGEHAMKGIDVTIKRESRKRRFECWNRKQNSL